MQNDLILEGKKFISSRRAAQFCGYTQDYIGQLIRGRKVDARMVGRSWFVSEESLISYKAQVEEIQKQKSLSEGVSKRDVSPVERIENSPLVNQSPDAIAASSAIEEKPKLFLDERPFAERVRAQEISPELELYTKNSLVKKIAELPLENKSSTPFLTFTTLGKKALVSALSLSLVIGGLWAIESGREKMIAVEMDQSSLAAIVTAPTDASYGALEIIALGTYETFYPLFNRVGNALAHLFSDDAPDTLAIVSIDDVSRELPKTATTTGDTQVLDSIATLRAEMNTSFSKVFDGISSILGQSYRSSGSGETIVTSVPVSSGVTSLEMTSQLASVYSILQSQINRLVGTTTVTTQNVRNARDANVTAKIVGSDISDSVITGSTFSGTSVRADLLTVSGVGTTTILGTSLFDTDSLVIDAVNHRIGVGTTSPYEKLSVSGNFVADAIFGISTSATSTIAGGFTLGTTGLVYQGATKNIGFGTTSPLATLDILQSANGTPIISAYRVTDTAPTGDFINYRSRAGTTLFRVDNSGNLLAGGIINTGSQTVTSLIGPQFRVQYDGSNEITTTVSSSGTTTLAVSGTTPSLVFTPQANRVTSFQFTDASAIPVLSIDTQNQRVGVGTTSPWGELSVNPNGIAGPAFVVGSSTKTDFMVTNGGNVAIGTSTSSFGSNGGRLVIDDTKDGQSVVRLLNLSDSANSYAEFNVRAGSVNAYLGATPLNSSVTTGAASAGRGYVWNSGTGNLGLDIVAASPNTDLRFYTGGSSASNERVRITSAGSVGIGTTSPLARLAISNFNGGSTPLFFIASSTGSGATTTNFIVDAYGNVGVNTTSRTLNTVDFGGGVFAVSGRNTNTNGNVQIIGNNIVNATGVVGRLAFTDNTAETYTNVAFIQVNKGGTSDSGEFLFQTKPAGGSLAERMRITSTGNVGIGTTTPFAKLSVAGDVYIGGNLTATGTATVVSSAGNQLRLAYDTSRYVDTTVSSQGLVTFQNNSSVLSGGASMFTFRSTAGPALGGYTIANFADENGVSKATISNLGAISSAAGSFSGSNNGVTELRSGLGGTSGGPALVLNGGASHGIAVQIQDGSQTFVTFRGADTTTGPAGAVGIGTTTPFAKLSVAGDAYIGGNLTATGTTLLQPLGTSDIGLTVNTANGVNVLRTLGANNPRVFIGNGAIDTGNGTNLMVVGAAGNGTSTAIYTGVSSNRGLAIVGTSGQSADYFNINSNTGIDGNIFTVQADGNVGIGTTSPSSKLEIGDNTVTNKLTVTSNNISSVIFNDQGGSPRVWEVGTNGNKFLIQDTTSAVTPFTIEENAVSNMLYLDNSGNVGVGTTTPANTLTVDGVAPVFGVYASTNSRGVTIDPATYGITSINSTLNLNRLNSNNVVAVTGGGNFGVGTGTPFTKLSVAGDVYIGGNLTATGTTALATTTIRVSSGVASAIYPLIVEDPGSRNRGIAFGIETGSSGSTIQGYAPSLGISGAGQRLNINPGGGDVYVGSTAAPIALFANGTIRQPWSNNFLGTYFSGGTYRMGLTTQIDNNNRVLYIENQNADGIGTNPDIQFRVGPTPSTVMTIRDDGNVGIATTSPFARLSVAGDAYIGGNLTATGTLSANAFNVTGTGTTTFAGDILARGIAAWQYLTAPTLVATSTTGTSTFAGGFAVKNNAFVVENTTGKVIIGGTSPISSAALTVRGGQIHVDDGSSSSGINMTGGVNSTITSQTSGDSIAINAGTTLSFGTYSGAFVERARFSNAGNFGVGTTTPWAQLSASSTSASPTLAIQQNGAGPAATFLGGNVGISTTSPTFKLDIAGDNVGLLNVTDTQAADSRFTVGAWGETAWRYANQFLSRIYWENNSDAYFELYKDGGSLSTKIHADGVSYFNGGNVGIGTTTPMARLQVDRNGGSGDVVVLGDGIYRMGALGIESATNTFYVGNPYSSSNLQFRTSGTTTATTRMTIDSTGNVGIGTTTPSHKLDIFSNSDTKLQIQGTGNDFIKLDRTAVNSWYIGNNSGGLAFDTSSIASGGSKLFVSSAGNIGIGTTTPSNKLVVFNASSVATAQIMGGGVGTTQSILRLTSVTNEDRARGIMYDKVTGGTPWYSGMVYGSDGYTIGRNASSPETLANSLFYIHSGGNVGIGTTSPTATMSVRGGAGTYIADFGGGSAANPAIRLLDSSTFVSVIGINQNNTTYNDIDFRSGNTSQLRISTNGNVGIGTTTPATNLQVSGTTGLRIAGTTSNLNTVDLVPGVASSYDRLDFKAVTANRGVAFQLNPNGTSQNSKISLANAQSSTDFGSLFISTEGAQANISSQTVGAGTPVTNLVFGGGTGASNWTSTAFASGNVGIGTTTPSYPLHTEGVIASNNGGFRRDKYSANSQGQTFDVLSAFIGGSVNVAPFTNPAWKIGGTVQTVGSSLSNVDMNFYQNNTANGTPFIAATIQGGTGNLGIGTSSPFSKLSVAGDAYIGGNLTATGTLAVSGASTFSGILNVLDIYGTGSGGLLRLQNRVFSTGATAVQLLGSNAISNSSGQFIGLALYPALSQTGSASYTALLVNPTETTLGSGTSYLADFQNSGVSRFNVTNTGNVGIGTSSPYSKLSVAGQVVAQNFVATSTTATSTVAGGLDVGGGAMRYDFSSGVTTIDNLEIGNTFFESDAGIITWADLPVTSASANGVVNSYSASINGNPLLTLYSTSDGAGNAVNQNVGIGSSTPWGKLAINPVAGDVNQFVVGSSTRTSFIINPAGNVGIGTTTPSAKLNIMQGGDYNSGTVAAIIENGGASRATVRLRTTSDNPSEFAYDVNSALRWMWSARSSGEGYALNLYPQGGTPSYTTVSNAVFSVLQGGNVGIGTTTPQKRLSVVGDGINLDNGTAENGIYFTTGGGTARMQLYRATSQNDIRMRSSNGGLANSGDLMTWDYDAGNVGVATNTPWGLFSINPDVAHGSAPSFVIGSSTATRFVVNNAGQVGIGTVAPITALHVSAVAPTIRLEDTNTTIKHNINGAGGVFSLTADTGNGAAGSRAITFNLFNTEYARLGSTGNLGVGTTTPWAELSVNPNGIVGPSFVVGSSTKTDFIVTNAGNVGIGTTSPQRLLHVYRSSDGPPVRFEDSNGYCEIDPTSTSWTCTSDRNLKKDITDLTSEDTLSRIALLNAVSFHWNKDTDSDALRYGFIAQDVEEVFPELVLTADNGLKSVMYGGFTPFIIEAIKELDLSLASLSDRVTTLDVVVTDLASSLASTTSALASTTAELTARLDATASLVASLLAQASSTASTTPVETTQTIVWSSDIGTQMLSFLESVGLTIENGIAYVQGIVSDVVTTKKLTVGDSANLAGAGVTILDRATGQPACVYIENSIVRSEGGACGALPTATSDGSPTAPVVITDPAPTPVVDETATTTLPVIVDDGSTASSTDSGVPVPEPVVEPAPEPVLETTPTPEPAPETVVSTETEPVTTP